MLKSMERDLASRAVGSTEKLEKGRNIRKTRKTRLDRKIPLQLTKKKGRKSKKTLPSSLTGEKKISPSTVEKRAKEEKVYRGQDHKKKKKENGFTIDHEGGKESPMGIRL